MAAASKTKQRESEQQRVVSWRTKRFVDMGYTLKLAATLAESGVDRADIQNLLDKGCPLKLAAKIAL